MSLPFDKKATNRIIWRVVLFWLLGGSIGPRSGACAGQYCGQLGSLRNLDYRQAMRDLSAQNCQRLRQQLGESVPLLDALPRALGEAQVAGGLWRFFSAQYPKGGVAEWNSRSAWKREWSLRPAQFHAFGEDVFGNQLIVRPAVENVHLWNHENGDMVDLLLDPEALLETVVQSGIDWIDFYGDGSLKIAEGRVLEVPPECHLHWTTPLILGGQVSEANTSVVERNLHLVGHAKLWMKLRGSAPGTIVVPTRKPSA